MERPWKGRGEAVPYTGELQQQLVELRLNAPDRDEAAAPALVRTFMATDGTTVFSEDTGKTQESSLPFLEVQLLPLVAHTVEVSTTVEHVGAALFLVPLPGGTESGTA